MFTQHTKINQLDTGTKKISSNNDYLLIEKKHAIMYRNHSFFVQGIVQYSEYLVQGLLANQLGVENECNINVVDGQYHVFENVEKPLQLNPMAIEELHVQHDDVIDWVAMFRSGQLLYRQTGATQSIGICLPDKTIHTIECVDFFSSLYKMLGALLKKYKRYYPVCLFPHRIIQDHVPAILMLSPSMVICQSAISAQALQSFINERITVFGFCRKNKFNRYSNFHI